MTTSQAFGAAGFSGMTVLTGYGTRHANMAYVRGRANDTEAASWVPHVGHRFSACLMPARKDARLQSARALHTRPPR
eukprot:1779774-Prymnesium_polylepis.2